jgi:hypothetical protein
MSYSATLEVKSGQHTFRLTEEDDILLFEAKVNRGTDFDFTVPGSDEPIRISMNGLSWSKSHSYSGD